jgi:glycosyltransferase involved in cell wall biosynthesis
MGPSDDARRSAAASAVDTVSVIICAYTLDRWDDLVRAVDSVRMQTRPALETIVVIDGNEELKRRAEEQLDGVAVVMNTHSPGLSGARLTGGDHAAGAILAFLDDDAIADDVWLEEHHAAYDDPNVLGAGGRVDPLWENGRPAWSRQSSIGSSAVPTSACQSIVAGSEARSERTCRCSPTYSDSPAPSHQS